MPRATTAETVEAEPEVKEFYEQDAKREYRVSATYLRREQVLVNFSMEAFVSDHPWPSRPRERISVQRIASAAWSSRAIGRPDARPAVSMRRGRKWRWCRHTRPSSRSPRGPCIASCQSTADCRS